MPEMLKPTSMLVGTGLEKDIALITDGRFSGGSHGFIIGHITPEAYVGGPIAHIMDGDMIHIDAIHNIINVEENLDDRQENWTIPEDIQHRKVDGYLGKYRKLVSDASQGATTT